MKNYLKSYYKYHDSKFKFMKIYYFLKFKLLAKSYGSAFPINAKCGKNIKFPHGLYGIFISKDAIIGDNCVIFHQVTIGRNDIKNSKGYGTPIIGNNVYIGCGAKIIGNVKVGNNVKIGANCVITKDIPDNSTCVVGPNRIIRKGEKNEEKN